MARGDRRRVGEDGEDEQREGAQLKRRCNVLKLIDRVDVEIIDAEKLLFYNQDLYFKMNKAEDYELFLNKLQIKSSSTY